MTKDEEIQSLELELEIMRNQFKYIRNYAENLFMYLWLTLNKMGFGKCELNAYDILRFRRENSIMTFTKDNKDLRTIIEAKIGREQNIPSKP